MGRNVTILAIVLLAFFLVPVIPYTFASSSFVGANAQTTGDVAFSYVVLHCGVVVNVQSSASFQGYSASRPPTNPGWVCTGNN